MDWIHTQQNKDSRLLGLYQVTGYPTTLLLDREGVIVARDGTLRREGLLETVGRYIE